MNIDNIPGTTTPFYLYDTDLLRSTLDAIHTEVQHMPHLHVHYAVKANANPIILREVLAAGLGIDCVSGGEIQTVLDAGFPASQIVFAGVGKADWEIRLALDAGIFCFNVESKEELEVISQLAQESGKEARVCLRINPDVGAHTHSHITTGRAEDKFGIAMQDMEHVIGLCALLPNIEFLGLHLHIGSQILDMADFIALAHRTNELQDRLERQGIAVKVINVGGGLGVDYDNPNTHPVPDFHAYFAVWADHLVLRPGQELHCELGRSIVAQCGSLITRVLYVKEGHERKFVIADAGMTDLIRPALYGARHKIENISVTENLRLTDWLFPVGQTALYDVVGPICESSDTFATDAYGETMASCYNCRPLPHGYSIDELSEK